MEVLAGTGCVRTLDEAVDAIEAPQHTAPDPIVITFDDGTADFAELAVPVLARHGLPATLYVATDFVDRGVAFPADGTPISWAALREVEATGLVTIGSHTHTHALLDRLPPEGVEQELDRADDLIEEHLGTRPRHFAYPKAVAGSSAADGAVRRRYRSAALAGTRTNVHGSTDVHRLARSPIQASDGMRYFRAKLAGGMHLEDCVRANGSTGGGTGARPDDEAVGARHDHRHEPRAAARSPAQRVRRRGVRGHRRVRTRAVRSRAHRPRCSPRRARARDPLHGSPPRRRGVRGAPHPVPRSTTRRRAHPQSEAGCLRAPGRRAPHGSRRSSTPCTACTRPRTTAAPSARWCTRSSASPRRHRTPSWCRTPRTSRSCADSVSRPRRSSHSGTAWT